ncbi:MAG: hypothetical protein ACHQDD_09870 [Steroidobacterales bacterium]
MKKAPTVASSSFAIVADLRPLRPVIILSTPLYFTKAGDGSGYDHRVAVIFDEDEDERVIDVLTAILYRDPHAFARIGAVHEHKGLLTLWHRGMTAGGGKVIDSATDPTVLRGDSWSVKQRPVLSVPGAERGGGLDLEVAQLCALFGLAEHESAAPAMTAANELLRDSRDPAMNDDEVAALVCTAAAVVTIQRYRADEFWLIDYGDGETQVVNYGESFAVWQEALRKVTENKTAPTSANRGGSD